MKWEYTSVTLRGPGISASPYKLLNNEGEQGWELVSVNSLGEYVEAYFKRPLNEAAE